MKKFLRISWGADSTPLRLLGSVVFAFVVMLYVNISIGGFGGLPIFIAYAFVFYLVRAVFVSGNRLSHFLAMDSGKELRYLYVSYVEGFLLFYAIMKLVSVFAKIAGWGNATGMTIQEYIRQLYGTSIMERWAYIFTFVFVMGFVFSMFPLLVAKDTKIWLGYAVADFALHLVLIIGIVLSCMSHIPREFRGRVKCLLDALLLCNIKSIPRIVTYFVIIAIYILASIVGSYMVARKIYKPKPGKKVKNPELFVPLSSEKIEEVRAATKKKVIRRGFIALVIVIVLGTAFVYYFFISKDNKKTHIKVGEWLTSDLDFGPVRYGANVYIPVNQEAELNETGKSLGYLGKRGENTTSRYYRLAIANILYKSREEGNHFLQVYGQENHSYLPAYQLEQDEAWREDEFFLLWDEDWKSESLYSKEPTGYSICTRELIEALETEFGVVSYNADDFVSYDAYFTISGYKNIKSALTDGIYPGDWVGCILIKDDRFYYGTYQNEITGDTRLLLLEALGGAKTEE